MKFTLVITLILITTFVGAMVACNADPTADANEKPPGWRCGIVNGQLKTWYITAEGAAGPKTLCPGCNADKCVPKSPAAERGGSGGSNGNGDQADDNPPHPVEEESGNASDKSESPEDCFPPGSVNLKHVKGGCP